MQKENPKKYNTNKYIRNFLIFDDIMLNNIEMHEQILFLKNYRHIKTCVI